MSSLDNSKLLRSAGKSPTLPYLDFVISCDSGSGDNLTAFNNSSDLKRKRYGGKEVEEEETKRKRPKTNGGGLTCNEKTAGALRTPIQFNAKAEYRIEYLRKAGESFLQDGPCSRVAPRLSKCQECKWAAPESSQSNSKILCRFDAFRRLRYTKTGNLATAGFLDPHRDATQEDLCLWLPRPVTSPSTLDLQTSLFLLLHVGSQFCQLLEQEREAIILDMAETKMVAWKRMVQGVREMCDVCKTALFNFHWVCAKCGFVVCIDCYKSRRNGLSKKWLLCTNGRGHSQETLMLTQIVPGDCLETLGLRLGQQQAMCATATSHHKDPKSSCDVDESSNSCDTTLQESPVNATSSHPANTVRSTMKKNKKRSLNSQRETEPCLMKQSDNKRSTKVAQEVAKHRENKNIRDTLVVPRLLMKFSKNDHTKDLAPLQQTGRHSNHNQIIDERIKRQQQCSKDQVIEGFDIFERVDGGINAEQGQSEKVVGCLYENQMNKTNSKFLKDNFKDKQLKGEVEILQNTVQFSNGKEMTNGINVEPLFDSFENKQIEVTSLQTFEKSSYCIDVMMNRVTSLPLVGNDQNKQETMDSLQKYIAYSDKTQIINTSKLRIEHSEGDRRRKYEEIQPVVRSIDNEISGNKTSISALPSVEHCKIDQSMLEVMTLKSYLEHFSDIGNHEEEILELVVDHIDGNLHDQTQDKMDTLPQTVSEYYGEHVEPLPKLQHIMMECSENGKLRDKMETLQSVVGNANNNWCNLAGIPQPEMETFESNNLKDNFISFQPVEEDTNNNQVMDQVDFSESGLLIPQKDYGHSGISHVIPKTESSKIDTKNDKETSTKLQPENIFLAHMKDSWRMLQDPCPLTPTRSRSLCPDVPHSWLCGGRLLHLYKPNHPENFKLFQDQWRRGQPVLVSDVTKHLEKKLWHPESFARDFGDTSNVFVDCMTGQSVHGHFMREFWEGFKHIDRRLKDEDGNPMLLKLKDWPPGDDFAEMLPLRYANLMKALPMGEYTCRSGRLNLVSCLPDCFVPPDLGPKMYSAYGSALHPSKGSTNLHLDVSDAVNVLVYVGMSNDSMEHARAVYRVIDKACSDRQTRRVRKKTRIPGALWHIYAASDAAKIRDLLSRVAAERGRTMEPLQDPIHDQNWYLDSELRGRLMTEYGVEGYAIVQCLGDAIFIPAGAPHQVQNLNNCIKVAEDFVSPENISHCFRLMQEFRELSDVHLNHEDKLQVKNIIYHAVKDALSVLPLE